MNFIKKFFRKRRYNSYMKSKRWEELRKFVMHRDGYMCFLCSSNKHLEVHHIAYPRDIYDTKAYGTITVCSKCHKKLHKKVGNYETC